MYDHATFQDGSPAHSESVDTRTRPGKHGKPEWGEKRCGMVVCRLKSPADVQSLLFAWATKVYLRRLRECQEKDEKCDILSIFESFLKQEYDAIGPGAIK